MNLSLYPHAASARAEPPDNLARELNAIAQVRKKTGTLPKPATGNWRARMLKLYLGLNRRGGYFKKDTGNRIYNPETNALWSRTRRRRREIRHRSVVYRRLNQSELVLRHAQSEVESEPERGTPSPVDPEHIEVQVNFEPDPTDLVLSSVPGGELFNPRKHKFSDEELKPQPMIKKAKKVFVPEESKDEKYWSRRRKNNVAAKRSRDARRLKENQITVRAAFLEKENAALRAEVAELRRDFGRYKNIVARYQAKFGPL
ncbi:TEF factor, partial [Polypterus senegalus]